ncbi:outer membrane lipoprotein carrier protein [Azospirillaceae bacterium]
MFWRGDRKAKNPMFKMSGWKSVRRHLACGAVAAFLTTGGAAAVAWADAPTPVALSASDRGEIQKVEQYLNQVHTLKARFLQTSESGHQATGTLYLSRPGRMRLEYDPPIKDYIVADGLFVFMWDGEMEQSSSTPIGNSLAEFILRDHLKLAGDIAVTGLRRDPGVIEVSLIERDDAGKGELTLVFETAPLRLRKWRVVDAQGATTQVALLNVENEISLDDKLFYFVAPKKSTPTGKLK